MPPERHGGALALGRYRPVWAAPEVEISPALKFLTARQLVELSPQDAQRLGLRDGEDVEVAANGYSVRGVAALRTATPEGSAFVAEGIAQEGGNGLGEESVAVVRPKTEPVL